VPDVVSREKRSQMMSGIRARDTKPEMTVRRWLHAHGFRYRLHVRTLPGTPDIVLSKYRTVVFVHGCFWHRHPGCRYAYAPKTREQFWAAKLDRNVIRDAEQQLQLTKGDWHVLVVWECETQTDAALQLLVETIRHR
jgi:DNA mismatch endonuclease (patch repair protein)